MRIAHVSDCYLPRTGGIETQVRSLALAQSARGDHVRIITASPGHENVRAGHETVDGLPVERIAMSLPAEIPVHLRTRARVVESLRADPVDVVHVHAGVISPFAWGAVRAAHQLGVPTVVTVHSVWGAVARPAFGASNVLMRWAAWGIVLSAVSQVAADRVSEAVGTDVQVLPNGIDAEAWRPLKPWIPQPGELRVVSVLRLAPRKRVGALLRTIARASVLLAPDVRVRTMIIGDGPERGRAERLARRWGLDATFTGRLPAHLIRARFSDSDVFAQASVKESFGIAALEARAAGLPVLARSQSGSGEFIADGLNGFLAVDDAVLADRLVLLGRDPELLARMHAVNASTEPDQTWPRVCVRAQELYASAGAPRASA